MERLRKLDKEEILYNMFPKVGDKFPIETILERTGIINNKSLKVIMHRLGNAKVFPKDKTIKLSQCNGDVLRIS